MDCGANVESSDNELFQFVIDLHKKKCPGKGEDDVVHPEN